LNLTAANYFEAINEFSITTAFELNFTAAYYKKGLAENEAEIPKLDAE
jgi:hypothetical protein